jgi:uncharacterized metal-binding protein YceD (DUF177 family)
MKPTTKPPAAPAWSVPVAAADIPETGRRLDLVADEAIRQAIVKAAGLAGLPRLEAQFDLTRHGADGLQVAGVVAATVVQHCVVTLEPIESAIEETVDLVFRPQPESVAEAAREAAREAASLQSPEAAEPPEPLRNGAVDLGAIATEFLLLGLDPYPRKPGAVFDAPVAEDDPSSHPFAALAALKKPGDRNQG